MENFKSYFNEGDDYFTIEWDEVDGKKRATIVWSCWDDQSEEMHDDPEYTPDYYRTVSEAKHGANDGGAEIFKFQLPDSMESEELFRVLDENGMDAFGELVTKEHAESLCKENPGYTFEEVNV